MAIPKIVWFCWFQGIDSAPEVVRRCHDSWVARNPGWRVIVLDQATTEVYGSFDYSSRNIAALSPQHRADLLRLDLLDHHGGVWADATCFCAQPLDEWLPPLTESGFFAFSRPRRGYLLSNWFLAARPGNLLVRRMLESMGAYWDRPFRHNRYLRKSLSILLSPFPQTRAWWFSPLFRDILRLSPYFAFHYGFERLVRNDPECARAWMNAPEVSADGPHLLIHRGLRSALTPALREAIDRPVAPVFKTTWKFKKPLSAGSLLAYLISSLDRQMK